MGDDCATRPEPIKTLLRNCESKKNWKNWFYFFPSLDSEKSSPKNSQIFQSSFKRTSEGLHLLDRLILLHFMRPEPLKKLEKVYRIITWLCVTSYSSRFYVFWIKYQTIDQGAMKIGVAIPSFNWIFLLFISCCCVACGLQR